MLNEATAFANQSSAVRIEVGLRVADALFVASAERCDDIGTRFFAARYRLRCFGTRLPLQETQMRHRQFENVGFLQSRRAGAALTLEPLIERFETR